MPPLTKRKLYKVLISGDREYRQEYAPVIRALVRELAQKHGTRDLLIIEGGSTGVDSMAKIAAQAVNIHVAEVEALWEARHASAGSQRNEIMALMEPDEVVCIHHDISKSKGTKRMKETAEKLDIPVRVLEPKIRA